MALCQELGYRREREEGDRGTALASRPGQEAGNTKNRSGMLRDLFYILSTLLSRK